MVKGKAIRRVRTILIYKDHLVSDSLLSVSMTKKSGFNVRHTGIYFEGGTKFAPKNQHFLTLKNHRNMYSAGASLAPPRRLGDTLS